MENGLTAPEGSVCAQEYKRFCTAVHTPTLNGHIVDLQQAFDMHQILQTGHSSCVQQFGDQR